MRHRGHISAELMDTFGDGGFVSATDIEEVVRKFIPDGRDRGPDRRQYRHHQCGRPSVSKLNPHADTRILCPTFDEGRWVAQGNSRAEAEAYYMNAIATEVIRPPMYRVIVQHKGQPARPPEHVVRAALRT